MTVLLASIVDTSILLALAFAAGALLRRRSAALRHAALALAIVAAALTPALELVVPQLPVIRMFDPAVVVSSGLTLTSADLVSGQLTDDGGASSGEELSWSVIVLLVWVPGALVTCAGLVTGLLRLARLRGRCTPVTGRWRELADQFSREHGLRRRVALLQSVDPSLLVTCGVLNPAIILPAGALQWADDRIRIVLRHELAHIARQDALAQLAGEILRILQWINPLVWIACRRLRQESEYACDDAVLNGGVEATEYAAQLLDVARHLSARQAAWAAAPAIAHPSTLERRIAAMLHRDRIRTPLGRRGWSMATLVALAVSLPLAAAGVAPSDGEIAAAAEARDATFGGSPRVIQTRTSGDASLPAADRGLERPPARTQPASVTGVVLDQSGGAIPGARLTLTDIDSGAQTAQHTDVAGRFAFRELQPARYELTASLAGFTTVRDVLPLGSSAAVERTIMLPIGSLSETVTIACVAAPIASRGVGAAEGVAWLQRFIARSITGTFPVLTAQQARPAPVRIGGNIRPPRKLVHVKPVCPPSVPAGETAVRLTGRVGVDGFLNDLRPLPAEPGAEPPTELVDSALAAVQQWTFTPTLLNGEEVEITITVLLVFSRTAGS